MTSGFGTPMCSARYLFSRKTMVAAAKTALASHYGRGDFDAVCLLHPNIVYNFM